MAQQSPAPGGEVHFALGPAQVNANELIDYHTAKGQAIYKMAVKPLPHKFDLKPEKLKPFIKELGTQVDKYG
jgi:hypothetical protein